MNAMDADFYEFLKSAFSSGKPVIASFAIESDRQNPDRRIFRIEGVLFNAPKAEDAMRPDSIGETRRLQSDLGAPNMKRRGKTGETDA